MKLTAVLFLVGMLQVSASSYSQNTKLTVALKNASIADVFDAIEAQSDFRFLYRNELVDMSEKVNISADNSLIDDILTELFTDVEVNYKVLEDNLIVITPNKALQEKVSITGTVTNREGESLPGVNVVEKGTTNGTISDIDGNYSLTVSGPDAVLVFSYIGYLAQETLVGENSQINVSLFEDIQSLDEVVVIGYGIVQKSDLTGAVTTIDTEDMLKTPSTNINEALQGKASGVQVIANSGSPGAGMTVRIRGIGTLTNSDPLYVVDGIPFTPNEMNFLNPENVESMSILKDASATAIYGSRGANGVILIETKKGSNTKGKNTVNFSMYTGTQKLIKKIDVANAEQFATIWNNINHGEDTAQYEFKNLNDYANTDWQDEIFRDAPVQNYHLSLNGGNEISTYSFSVNFMDQKGILKGTDFSRINLRVNSTHKIGDRITLGEKILLNHSIQHTALDENQEYSSAIANALFADPLSEVYVPDSLGGQTWGQTLLSNHMNPVATIDLENRKLTDNKFFGNFFVDVEIIKGLIFKSSTGIKLKYREVYDFLPIYYYDQVENNAETDLRNDYETSTYWNWENTLTYYKEFGKHSLTVLAGMTAEEEKYKALKVENILGVGPEDEVEELRYFDYYTNTEGWDVRGPAYENSLISYLGRIDYIYDNRYLFTASVRRDGSSRFGENYERIKDNGNVDKFNKGRWGTFPSLALGWKVSNESFFSNVPYVSSLKLRYGWGQTGNQNIGNYPFAATVSANEAEYAFDQAGTILVGASPYIGDNPSVHWETTVQTNLGFDAGIFDNKLYINGEYYIRETRDMLVQVPSPYISGLPESPYQNIGNIENKGIEVEVGYRKNDGNLTYSLGGNISTIRNEVTNLNTEIFSEGGWGDNASPFVRIEEGLPVGAFYVYKSDGLFQSWEEVTQGAQATARPGDVRYMDINKDGKITQDDMTFVGNPHPDFIYGLNLQLNYKIFDLTLFGQGSYGNDIFYPAIRWLYDQTANGRNVHSDLINAWTPENTNTDIPRYGSDSFLSWSDRMIFDGSYFRLKTLEVGISLPQSILSFAKLQRFRVYFNAKNMLTLTDYPGFDPEIGRAGREEDDEGNQQLIYGVDYSMYPPAKSFIFGIQMSF